jgi:hypothetical protein
MGARFYSPQLGVFTQLDSVRGNTEDPSSLNRFLYAEANPATFIDPDGHSTLCGPYTDLCTVGGKLVANPDSVEQMASPSTSPACTSSGCDSPSGNTGPSFTFTVLPNGIVLGPDGSMVSHDQYKYWTGACSVAGPPAGSGGICDAWWKTEKKEFANQGTDEQLWASDAALSLVSEFFKKYGDKLDRRGAIDLRISLVKQSQQMFEGATKRSGAMFEFSAFESATGDLLKIAGRSVFLLSVVLSFSEQYSSDEGKHIDPFARFGRAFVKAGSVALAGAIGAAGGAGVAVGICAVAALLTAGIGEVGCGVLAIVLGGAGAFAGGELASQGVDEVYQWIDAYNGSGH